MTFPSLSRRTFVAATSSMLLASNPQWMASAAVSKRRIPVGVQLWTLRRELAEDLPGTLHKVAQIGYEGIELWFQQWPKANDLKKIVDDCGLKIASAHVNLKDLLEDFPRIAEYHRTIRNQTLVIPYIPNNEKLSPEDWRKTIDDIRQAARSGTEAGFTMLYHNHDFEFKTRVDNVEVFDLIYDTIDKKLLGAEIDVFFVADVGRDPAALLSKFKGRLKRVHLKDKSKPGEKSKNTELGHGTIDLPAVIAAAAGAGTEWYLVEQNCEDRPALESIRVSYEYLRHHGV
jgi:sugar phosphate isomerase/epimerase